MFCIVSVVDSISVTSMPINEFVIYRSIHNYKMRQIVIVCDTHAPADVMMPDDVEFYLIGNDHRKIRNLVKDIQKECEELGDDIVYHMHHQKSALTFFYATRFLGIREHSLYTVHSTFSGRNFKYRLSSCVCVLMSKYANCVSVAAYQGYASLIKKLKGDYFTVIPNGVDIVRIDEIIERNMPQKDPKTLICVGRMIPLKNHAFLIKLMKSIPGYRLILIGAEDGKGRIRALAVEEGVENRIEFKGMIPRNDVFKELGRASIYVSASFVEGLPVSVLEAMRAGLIPFFSDITPHKEIAMQCEEVRVLPLDERIWISTIKQIAGLPNEEFNYTSEKIKASVKEYFSLDKMHKQYLEIYRALVRKH